VNGFEIVYGGRFSCFHCKFRVVVNYCELKKKYLQIFPIYDCDKRQLSDDCINRIKQKDKKIEETKIDTHPRFPIIDLDILDLWELIL